MSTEGANFNDPNFQDKTNVNGLAASHTVCFTETTIVTDLTPLFSTSISMTFELYVKTCTATSCQGVIFSYAVKKTFAVWNRGTVVITYDTFIWDTGLPLESDRWNQIAVVWTKAEYKLEVYVFHSSGEVIGKAQPTEPIPKPNPFQAGGKLTLGRWQVSSRDSGGHTQDSFVGCIEELRIWQK